jgi:hypothetical protein
MYQQNVLYPICQEQKLFICPDDYSAGRDGNKTVSCPYTYCLTRERAVFGCFGHSTI